MSKRQQQTEHESSRRSVLVGLVGGITGVTALGSTGVAASSYESVVDLVDGGADPDGSTSIVPLLDQYAADDTLVKLPPGEYLMTEQFRFTGYDNFGLVGDDATIVPGSIGQLDGRSAVGGTFSGPTRLFRLGTVDDPGDGLRFEGITFDFTDDQSGFRALEAYCERDMLVRDVDVVGEHDVGSFGPALFSLTAADGNGTVEGFRAPDGGAYSANTVGDIRGGPTGILVPDSHVGKLRFRACELGGFPDNGLYASCSDGRVVVDGGVYRNSNVSNVRLAGDYSYVKGATVVVDENRPEDGNQRGIRLDEGEHLWVYDTEIRLEEPNGHAITVMADVEKARIQETTISVGNAVNHGIVVRPGAGPTDVYSSTIDVERGGHALLVEPDGGVVDCWYLTVTGDASGEGGGRHAVRCERDDCLFRHLVVNQPGPGYRRGLQVSGDDCYVYSGYYATSHVPIVNDGDDTLVEDVTARSLDGYEALKLLDHTRDVDVVSNRLYGGVWDDGSEGLYMHDNDFPTG
jgi:hypothetical protein